MDSRGYGWAQRLLLGAHLTSPEQKQSPFGPLTVDEVFVYFDGPRLFTCDASSGDKFLSMFVDENERSEDWLFAAISAEEVQAAKVGDIDLRGLFSGSTKRGAYLVEFDTEADTSRIKRIFASHPIPNELLPASGVSLLPSTALKPRVEVVQRLRVKSTGLGRLALAAVGRVSELWSDLIESFDAGTGQMGEMFALGATTGSVVLELGSDTPTLVGPAVDAVKNALAATQSPKTLRDALRTLSVDAFRVTALLEAIVDGGLNLTIETANQSNPIELTTAAARAAAIRLRVALGTLLDTSDVPQADSLVRLFQLVETISLDHVVDESSTGIVPRQIAYYKHAARTLGYLDAANAVTPAGEALLRSSAEGKMTLTATQFEASRCGAAWLKWSKSKQLTLIEPDSAYKFLGEVTLLSDSTARRRSKTLWSWIIELREFHYSALPKSSR